MIDLDEVLSKFTSDINNTFNQLQQRQAQTLGGLVGKFEQQMALSLSSIEATFSLTDSECLSTGN